MKCSINPLGNCLGCSKTETDKCCLNPMFPDYCLFAGNTEATDYVRKLLDRSDELDAIHLAVFEAHSKRIIGQVTRAKPEPPTKALGCDDGRCGC